MKMGDFPIFIITIWIKMMRYSRNICMTMGGIMKRTKLKRKVLFDITKDRDDIVYDFKMALINWEKFYNKPNTNKLKMALGVDDIVNVKLEILDNAEETDETLRLYVYKTKNCHIHSVKEKQFSHALQVSLGNEGARKNWVVAEEGFTAKVFPDSKEMLINLAEDIVLDMQMFYFYGYEKEFCDVESRKEFSRQKVMFLMQKNVYSYLGNIEDAEYVSFASFCRSDDRKIDFQEYKELWQTFDIFLRNVLNESNVEDKSHKVVISKSNIHLIIDKHPKGGQLSKKKLEKCLETLPSGKYALIRTEKKPRKSKQRIIIESRFGMKKWKTGKIMIVPIKYRFTYQKMIPYVSIYEFEWEG